MSAVCCGSIGISAGPTVYTLVCSVSADPTTTSSATSVSSDSRRTSRLSMQHRLWPYRRGLIELRASVFHGIQYSSHSQRSSLRLTLFHRIMGGSAAALYSGAAGLRYRLWLITHSLALFHTLTPFLPRFAPNRRLLVSSPPQVITPYSTYPPRHRERFGVAKLTQLKDKL